MSGLTLKKFNTPNTTASYRGRWGFDYKDDCCDRLANLLDVCLTNLLNGEILVYNEAEGCWENKPVPTPGDLCLNDLCDVCYQPPPAGPPVDGDFLVWNGVCWENSPIAVCSVMNSDYNIYHRLGARIIIPPNPSIDIPKNIDTGLTSLSIPLGNSTPGVGTDGLTLGTGMNNFYVRGLPVTTYYDLNHPDLEPLWVNIGPINPPIPDTPPGWETVQNNNASPLISLPPGKCFRVKYQCTSNPQLKAGRLDDGMLGMVFRLQSIKLLNGARDPTPDLGLPHYFQVESTLDIGGNKRYQPSYFAVTETGSWSFGNDTITVKNEYQSLTNYFRLQVIYFQGLRFNASTNTTLQGINVQDLFEIEPFFFLTREEIKLE